MNPKQLQAEIIDPTLKALGLYSTHASNLVLATAWVESDGLSAIRQYRGGPARGLWQVEPATADDIVNRYLQARSKAALRHRLADWVHWYQLSMGKVERGELRQQLTGNLYFGAALCRLRYFMSPAPIPETADGYAAMWKKVYNTHLGAGTEEGFLRKYATLLDAMRSAKE